MGKWEDERDYFVPRLQAYEERLMKELEVEQVRHIPLNDYAEGTERLEKLREAMSLAQRFTPPPHWTVNV